MTTMTMDPAAITILPAVPEPSDADEINHRIANSLQLLSAMVSVEARGIEDPAARAALETTRRRIGAIARVHRQLYQAREANAVDLGAYLEELGADLEQSCADEAAGRRVMVSAAPIAVSFEQATSIGIIVSELVANACKYAYDPDAAGDVRIGLRAMPLGGYRLEVEDHGHGLGPDAALRGTGLGHRLVEMMALRLGGRHGWHDASPGTRFVLCVGRT